MNKLFITDEELSKYGKVNNLSEKAEALLNQQKANWQLVKNNFEALNNVLTKVFQFEDFFIKTQFNPSRITSTSAKVDNKSIENRACFLCENKLPVEQKGISYNEKYVLLCNPYPIFKQHLTIPLLEHVPQNIENYFTDMLGLAYDLRDSFFVFYNGPKCGASAPDHLHFQAGLKNTTPLEYYYNKLLNNFSEELLSNEKLKVTKVENHFIKFVSIISSDKNETNLFFQKFLNEIKILKQIEEEPLLNIISVYENNLWNVIIFIREKHRPDQYFLEGENKILISPASVDIAGLCITPRKEDFEKLNKNDLKDIYSQVNSSEEFWGKITKNFFQI